MTNEFENNEPEIKITSTDVLAKWLDGLPVALPAMSTAMLRALLNDPDTPPPFRFLILRLLFLREKCEKILAEGDFDLVSRAAHHDWIEDAAEALLDNDFHRFSADLSPDDDALRIVADQYRARGFVVADAAPIQRAGEVLLVRLNDDSQPDCFRIGLDDGDDDGQSPPSKGGGLKM